MESYAVGQVVDKFIGHQECPMLDITDSGMILEVFFESPTEEEIKQFHSSNRFELRYTVMKNIFMFTIRVGTLNWMDTGYTPHLSENLTHLPIPADGEGLALTLMLIDAKTGEIKSIRLIGLSNKFSKKLLGDVLEEQMNGFDKAECERNLAEIYAKYTTNQLVKLCSEYCRVD